MKIQPDLSQTIGNLERAAELGGNQANKEAVENMGVGQSTVAPPQDTVGTSTTVPTIEGTPIDVGAPPPAPAVAPDGTGASAGVFAENLDGAVAGAGDSPFSNPTADNLARAFLAQQVFSDRQDIEAEEELLTVSGNLTQLAIANAKKEIERLKEELAKAEKQSSGGLFGGGGFMGKMFKVLDPIGSMVMESMPKPGDMKVEHLQQKLDNAHKRLNGLVNNFMAIGKHLRQLQEARLKEGAEQIAKETVETGPDGVPKGMQDKMKAALSDGLTALLGQDGVTLDQAVSSLTDRAVEVLQQHGYQVNDALKAQLGQSIAANLFDQKPPALEAVEVGVSLVGQYAETAKQRLQSPRTVLG